MVTPMNQKIFERSYAYLSKDLQTVKRDWEKVTKYGKRLSVLDARFEPNYPNAFLTWKLEGQSADPPGDQKRIVRLQKEIAAQGGFQRHPLSHAQGVAGVGG
ncbi:glycylpeptide N-tetradecanoyltransferase [Hypocenomyce scalaris]|nr:glycylpeptide N-tetradecanoyltransferase [Hypocenomyce scalaris]